MLMFDCVRDATNEFADSGQKSLQLRTLAIDAELQSFQKERAFRLRFRQFKCFAEFLRGAFAIGQSHLELTSDCVE